MTPGTMFTPAIRLVRPLDQGSMGMVWIAEHLGLGREVALKLMAADTVKFPTSVARFVREAQAAARIQSPHVVRIIDQGLSPEGTPFIAMELLVGESLKAYLDRRGRLDPPELCGIVREAALGLGMAHRLGVVHRDIKPANIFLAREDDKTVVKLLDFGIAKVDFDAAAMTRTSDRFGTPFYMSPEQMKSSKHVDARSDLWSLGVVAYHALTGVLPFKGAALVDIVISVNRGLFTRASSLRPDLPPRLDAWFSRILSVEPARRFASAEEASAELDRAAGVAS